MDRAARGVGLVALSLLLGCGSGAMSGATAPASSSATVGASPLVARPLRLPQLAVGAPCPTTPVSDVRVGIASPRGGPSFYLGGPAPHAGYAWNKTVYALVGASGPVLLRGGRLDGPGVLKFDGQPADHAAAGETLTAQGGVTRTFYEAVVSPAAIQQDGSRADVFYLYPSAPGCYAVQADGDGFDAVVVFLAAP